METHTILMIVGWPVSAVLALVVGVLVGRYNRPRKRLAWSLLNETRPVDDQSISAAATPIRVMIGDDIVTNVAHVRLKIANAGNQEIVGATAHVVFPPEAKIHAANLSALDAEGAFSKKVRFLITAHQVDIAFDHLNSNRHIYVELVVSNYPVGPIKIEMEEPGVEVIRLEPILWSSRLVEVFGLAFALSFPWAFTLWRGQSKNSTFKDILAELRLLRSALTQSPESCRRESQSRSALADPLDRGE